MRDSTVSNWRVDPRLIIAFAALIVVLFYLLMSALLFLRIERFHGHESGRIVRKLPQQSGVDDAEDRRVRADAQRERQDGDQREAGSLQQCAGTVV